MGHFIRNSFLALSLLLSAAANSQEIRSSNRPNSNSTLGSQKPTSEEEASCLRDYQANMCDNVKGTLKDEDKSKIRSCSQPETFKEARFVIGCGEGFGAFFVDAKDAIMALPGKIKAAPGKVADAIREEAKCSENEDYKLALLEGIKPYQPNLDTSAFARKTCGEVRDHVMRVISTLRTEVEKRKALQKRHDDFVLANPSQAAAAGRMFPERDRKLTEEQRKFVLSEDYQKDAEGLFSKIYKEVKKVHDCYTVQAQAKIACEIATSIFVPGAAAKFALSPKAQAILAKYGKKASSLAKDSHQRVERAENLLGRTLTTQEREALIKAHSVGEKQLGRDGAPASLGNYTQAQLKEKSDVLKDAGFSIEERRKILEAGIAGSPQQFAHNSPVLIPRSDGSTSKGWISEFKSDGTAVVYFEERGDVWQKVVKLDELTPTLSKNDPVLIPRKNGQSSEGWVAEFEPGGHAVVRFKENGETLEKTVHVDRLKPLNQSPTSPRGPPGSETEFLAHNAQRYPKGELIHHDTGSVVNVRPFRDPVTGQESKVEIINPAAARGFPDAQLTNHRGPTRLEPGRYTYAVLDDGTLVTAKVHDAWEVGAKHVNLANGRKVGVAGELKVLDDGSYQYNILSGSYSRQLISYRGISPSVLTDRAGQTLNSYFPKQKGYATPDELLPSRPPSLTQIVRYCNFKPFYRTNLDLCCSVARICN